MFLVLFPAARAQSPARVPNVRYLFIIDNSSAMSRLAVNTQATVFEMVSSGFYGQAHAGEIFGVWTFNDTVDQRALPLQTWLPELNNAIATRTAKFVQGLQYRRAPRLDRAVADMLDAIKLCDSLVVFIISDGADVVVGTPFDRPINITYGHRQDELRKAKRPFVTTFVSSRGEIVDWSVTAGGEKIVIPLGPIAAQLAATDFLASPARTIAPEGGAATPATAAGISPADTTAASDKFLALVPTRAADTQPSSSSGTLELASAPLKVEASAAPESPAGVARTAVQPNATLALAGGHAVADAPVITPAAGAAEVTSSPAERLAPPVLPEPVVAAVPTAPLEKWPWLVGGLALLALAAFLIVPQVWRALSPASPSLISRSLDRKGK